MWHEFLWALQISFDSGSNSRKNLVFETQEFTEYQILTNTYNCCFLFAPSVVLVLEMLRSSVRNLTQQVSEQVQNREEVWTNHSSQSWGILDCLVCWWLHNSMIRTSFRSLVSFSAAHRHGGHSFAWLECGRLAGEPGHRDDKTH